MFIDLYIFVKSGDKNMRMEKIVTKTELGNRPNRLPILTFSFMFCFDGKLSNFMKFKM